jgi:SAM-dependent MidA family methyltransferase
MDLDAFANDNVALRDAIFERVRAAGSIAFSEFMRLALYDPHHGYYQTCDPTLDYQSSPNVHPVFGAALGRQVVDFWRLLDRPARFDVFEAGAGSGRLAADLLRYVEKAAGDCYDALSYTLQDVTYGDDAEERLARAGIRLTKASFAQALPPPHSIEGCLLSNELIDALPFERVTVESGVLRELRVGLDGDRLVDLTCEARPELRDYFNALGRLPGGGCVAEVGLEARDWMQEAARALRRGYILTLDYGYEADQLYAPWRKRGTLLTFYRHTSGDDPYVRIGRQDITASVDFTTLRRAGEDAGLTTLGISTQTEFLAALGIGEALTEAPAPDRIEAYYALRKAVVELTDASGLGRIRVFVQGKDVPDELPLGLRRTGAR